MSRFIATGSPDGKTKLAVYLDELDIDPSNACVLARNLNFKTVCLRRVWTTNVGRATDDACRIVMSAIQANNLEVLAVCTDHGQTNNLTVDNSIERSIIIGGYFRAKYMRFFAGTGRGQVASYRIGAPLSDVAKSWFTGIGDLCVKHKITPLLEIESGATFFEPEEVLRVLAVHPAWRLLYDPAQLVIGRNHNPFERYWLKMRDKVEAIDLHDFLPSAGFVPIGSGNGRVGDTIYDAISSNYNGWYIVEPGAIRRSAIVISKPELVSDVTKLFLATLSEIQ